MSETEEKSIRFPAKVNQKLEKLALKHGRSKLQFFIQMVDYFYNTKKDPRDVSDEVLKNTILSHHQTYISFIKQQENTLFIPMKMQMEEMDIEMRGITRAFKDEVLGANKLIISNQNVQVDTLKQFKSALVAIHDKLDTKARLKQKFLAILNRYIQARERMHMFSGENRENLALAARKEVDDL